MPQTAGGDASAPKPPGALEFVLVDQPGKRSSGDVRRRVRSHVTKLQHQKNREREIDCHAATSRPFISYTSENAKNKIAPRKAGKVTKAKKPKPTVLDHASETAIAKRSHPTVLQIRSPKREAVDDDVDTAMACVAPPYRTDSYDLPLGGLGVAFSRGTMSFRTFALDDSTNTVGSSLEALGLDVSSVLGCYKLIVQIQARDFEQNYCNVRSGIVLWERFYKFVFNDPVLLTVALLITIRYRLECLGYRNRSRDFIQVLQLEDFLIKRVNAALKQPGRATSDPMLVAVALCSAYEVKNGNPQAYHVHMKGLMRMIHLRGGLDAVAEDDPYLARLLIWHDVNTAKVIGHEGYLAHLPNNLLDARPDANLKTFQAPIETDAEESDPWKSKFEL